MTTDNGNWGKFTSGVGSTLRSKKYTTWTPSPNGDAVAPAGGNGAVPNIRRFGGYGTFVDNGNDMWTSRDGNVYERVNGITRRATAYNGSARMPRVDPEQAYATYKMRERYGLENGKMARYMGRYYICDGKEWKPYAGGDVAGTAIGGGVS